MFGLELFCIVTHRNCCVLTLLFNALCYILEKNSGMTDNIGNKGINMISLILTVIVTVFVAKIVLDLVILLVDRL